MRGIPDVLLEVVIILFLALIAVPVDIGYLIHEEVDMCVVRVLMYSIQDLKFCAFKAYNSFFAKTRNRLSKKWVQNINLRQREKRCLMDTIRRRVVCFEKFLLKIATC